MQNFEFINVAEVSKILKIHKSKVYEYSKSGLIPHWRFGSTYRYDRKAVENLRSLLSNSMGIKDTAEFLGISAHSLYVLARAEKIPFTKFGGKYLFDKERLLKWLEENAVV